MALADRIIGAESGGNPYAANPRSSAYGAGQFIDSTWLDMLARYRPDLITGLGREEILALRANPDLSKAMTEAYASENAKVLTGSGLPVTPGTTYLAHFAGPQGAVKVLQADPSAPASSVLGEAAAKANPFLARMTVADLRAWADRKVGVPSGGAPSTPSPAQTTAAPENQTFGNLAMSSQVPQQQAAMGSSMPSTANGFGSLSPEAPMKPPPALLTIRRKPVDFSRLRAAFSLRA